MVNNNIFILLILFEICTLVSSKWAKIHRAKLRKYRFKKICSKGNKWSKIFQASELSTLPHLHNKLGSMLYDN